MEEAMTMPLIVYAIETAGPILDFGFWILDFGLKRLSLLMRFLNADLGGIRGLKTKWFFCFVFLSV